MFGTSSEEKAYLGPFVVFLAFLMLAQMVANFGDGLATWYWSSPQYWIFPLQTIVSGLLVWHWRGFYPLGIPRRVFLTLVIGTAVFVLWIAPQLLGLAEPRLKGFEPHFFGYDQAFWWNTAFRFIRLVIVVPLVEEIFWRGFLLRYLIRNDFTAVPFGTFEWRSFLIVTGAFCLEHQFADWPAAILAGALYNWVAYQTRSLTSCVIAHAVTNLLLGIYVMRTGQWGFW